MNQNKVYVGNLSYETTSDDLQALFGQYGKIDELKLITDRDTGRSKGFAFITFENGNTAQNALAQNGQDYQGRKLKVNFAKEAGAGGDRRRSGGGGRDTGRGGYSDRQW